jgi:hypothetical protein
MKSKGRDTSSHSHTALFGPQVQLCERTSPDPYWISSESSPASKKLLWGFWMNPSTGMFPKCIILAVKDILSWASSGSQSIMYFRVQEDTPPSQ